MNRILLVIVIALFPIAVLTKDNDSTDVFAGTTLENKSLEIPLLENEDNKSLVEEEKKDFQVLVSHQNDKSNPITLSLEEYVVGVVAGEMPASFQMEALKAQAIASRTFAMYKMLNVKDYVLSTTVNDQVYLTEEQMKKKWGSDYDYYYNRVLEAVKATEGEVLYYNNSIAITYYFAISNGYTESAKNVFNEDRDYLVPVSSSWDKNYQSYSSKRTIPKNDFCNRLNISCDSIIIDNIVRGDNHYVKSIIINDKIFSGLDVFNLLALKSTDFTIEFDDNNVYITTLGFGHGVGMSQYGAQGMACEGYSYKDILTHYYQNTEINKI